MNVINGRSGHSEPTQSKTFLRDVAEPVEDYTSTKHSLVTHHRDTARSQGVP